MADSGASLTITPYQTDLISMQTLEHPIIVQTASKSTQLQIRGVGSMFFKHEVLINGSLKAVQSKLDQVYWLPELSSCIISVGTLLQDDNSGSQ